MESNVYLAVQNGVILGTFSSYDEAYARCREEQQRDFLSIVIRRKLRKLFKKSGNVALHRYVVLTVSSSKEVMI